MATKMDQKAYLQKYLTGSSGDKKKKKKKAVKGKGFQIIDDDIDLSKLRPLEGDELDILDEGEDAPQIAGIVDERPEELKKIEQFQTSSKWRVVNQDDGFNSKLQIEEIKSDFKETVKENELVFGKMYSDSEDEKKNDSDLSPPRNNANKQVSKSNKHNSDSDFSPPRKREKSPPRKRNKDNQAEQEKTREKGRKQSRWGNWSPEQDNSNRNQSPVHPERDRRKSSSSDMSPPRKSKKNLENRDDSDVSPPRKSKKYDSPPKSRNKNSDSYDRSYNRNRNSKHDSTSYDSSRSKTDKFNKQDSKDYRSNERQPRKHSTEKINRRRDNNSDMSPPRKRRNGDNRNQSDSDQSPPRKHNSNKKRKKQSKYDSDSDHSPPRRKRDNNVESKRRQESDSDQSPPRKDRHRNNDSPPPSNKKMAKTLEGKAAGLQDARQLRQENAAFRKREDEVFNKMTDEVSGRNAQVVSRKGKRETSEDRMRQRDKADRQKELEEKYKKWSKGVKQLQDQEARVEDYLHEASKPLARLRDDKDLEHTLKGVERDGDPMLQYMRERRRERGELGPEKPSYKGSFPPNRFNIRPGYRWDGVDRSNGYEKKYFETQSKKKAQEEEAYKWSTEDL